MSVCFALQRNGTLTEVSTINTGLGDDGMLKFGYIDRLNGLDRLPFWRESPCRNISASEGSFFPPRELSKADTIYVYDKDLCRIIPLKYSKPVVKDGESKQRKIYKNNLRVNSSSKVLMLICICCREMFMAARIKTTNALMKIIIKLRMVCRI